MNNKEKQLVIITFLVFLLFIFFNIKKTSLMFLLLIIFLNFYLLKIFKDIKKNQTNFSEDLKLFDYINKWQEKRNKEIIKRIELNETIYFKIEKEIIKKQINNIENKKIVDRVIKEINIIKNHFKYLSIAIKKIIIQFNVALLIGISVNLLISINEIVNFLFLAYIILILYYFFVITSKQIKSIHPDIIYKEFFYDEFKDIKKAKTSKKATYLNELQLLKTQRKATLLKKNIYLEKTNENYKAYLNFKGKQISDFKNKINKIQRNLKLSIYIFIFDYLIKVNVFFGGIVND